MDLCAVSINLPLSLLAEMVIFVRVVEVGSFSEAARQLDTSPSAVSRSVARLEKALAIRLLQRTTRKLRLSDVGEEVFKRCQEVVGAAQSVMDLGGRFTQEAEGLVRVSVPKAVGRYVVHPHMPEFLRRYPKVNVQLILEDRYVDLIDDNVDLSIRITDEPPPSGPRRRARPGSVCAAGMDEWTQIASFFSRNRALQCCSTASIKPLKMCAKTSKPLRSRTWNSTLPARKPWKPAG